MIERVLAVRMVCAAIVGFAPLRALAETPPQPPSPSSVTIDQAIDEALAHNLTLLAERSNLSIADAAIVTARLRPNPVLSLSADHLDWLGTGFDETNGGGPSEYAARVDVPIERGGKRNARNEVAASARTAAEAQFADAVRTLRLDVTLACIDVLAAEATRDLVADTLRSFEDLARVNEARVAAGAIAPYESTRSQIAMLQFRSTVTKAELDLAAATARLRVLLGRPPSNPLDVSGDLSAPQELAPIRVDDLDSRAFESRPDLRALQLEEARSTADLRLQQANGKIDYLVGAEYRRQQGVNGTSNSLGFFFSTPLPFSNRNQGEIARANAQIVQGSQQVTASKAGIEADVESSLHEYTVTKELVASIERDLLAPARNAQEISSYTYRAGGSTLLELLDAQRAFNDTMQSYVDARASLRRAASRLNAAVGAEVVR